ncbi:MAG: MATE family efflux transporter [Planctomycetes bacterium]|nr:MATE family efflux transporter [Planctomycetota bacterium]
MAPEEVQKLQAEYCRVALWSLPFGVACAGLEGFFNGVQKPGVALKAIIAALVCNVVGNYLLIFGKFGLPAMGVQGAAIATLLGWALRVGILAIVFLSKEFHENYRTRDTWRFDASKLRGLVNVGGPTGIQWMLDIGAWFLFFAVIMQKFGTATLAASNIGMQYMHIAFMPAIGVGIALCTLVGHAIGEGKPEIARQKTRGALLVCVTYMGFIGLIFLAIPGFLVSFISTDTAVIEAGVGVLLWAALFQVSDALCIIYINALRGAGDTRWPAIVVVILCWTVFLSGGYMMATQMPHWKHHGPWMMCTLYITILGILFWRRFEGGAWRRINLFKNKVLPENDHPMAESNAEALAETAGAMP